MFLPRKRKRRYGELGLFLNRPTHTLSRWFLDATGDNARAAHKYKFWSSVPTVLHPESGMFLIPGHPFLSLPYTNTGEPTGSGTQRPYVFYALDLMNKIYMRLEREQALTERMHVENALARR